MRDRAVWEQLERQHRDQRLVKWTVVVMMMVLLGLTIQVWQFWPQLEVQQTMASEVRSVSRAL